MNPRSHPAHSYLFTVRLWWEDLGDGQWEWRGVVKLVTSGEEYFFRDWDGLKGVMTALTGALENESDNSEQPLRHDAMAAQQYD